MLACTGLLIYNLKINALLVFTDELFLLLYSFTVIFSLCFCLFSLVIQPKNEAMFFEVVFARKEALDAIMNLKEWMKPEKVNFIYFHFHLFSFSFIFSLLQVKFQIYGKY